MESAPSRGVREIFSLYGPQYLRDHKLPEHHRKTMFALQHCRTAVLGGHVDKCDKCGYTHVFYNSCRNRHCPLCQGLNSIKWVDKLSATLLPVSYFHIVFTIPSELNRMATINQECLYDILFKAASESLLMLAKDPKHLGVRTGMVAVLHTWGQNMMEHPHLHTLVPAGGWSDIGQCWQHSSEKFFIPVKVISSVFRGKFLAFLKDAYNKGEIKFEGEIKPLQRKNNFKKLLDTVYGKPWVVFAEKPFTNAIHVVKYLARYSNRVAIGNSRIESIEHNEIRFRWKDYKSHGLHRVMNLPAPEFIRRFLLHVLPKGFCKIRYFGIFAVRHRKTLLLQCSKALDYQSPKSKFEGLTWQGALQLASGIDVCKCPVCKTGTMKTIMIMDRFRGPPLENIVLGL